MSNRLNQIAGVAMLLTMVGSAAADQSDAARIQELERKLERSMQLIESLSNKVQQLEKSTTTASQSPAGGTQEASRLDALQRQVADMAAANARRGSDDGLPVHGFADVGMLRSNQNNIDRNGNPVKGARGFNVGTMDLYLTPQFGSRVKSLLELVFEVNPEGELATDLERVQMGYTFSDAATAWVGRFHTPYGYWNTAFHHGAQIQTSLSRPRFLDFEDKGGILPAHTTGAWLAGNMPVAGNKLGYDFYIGNAPRINMDAGNVAGALNMKMAGDISHTGTLGFNVSLRPQGLRELTVGVHGLRANKVRDTNDMAITRMSFLGGYAVYNNDDWEIMGEYYRFRNNDESGNAGTHNSSAWYVQAGYTFGLFTPYARFEKTSLDQDDNYFLLQESGRSYSRGAFGLRYELDPKSALKLEFNRTRQNYYAGGNGVGLHDGYSEALFQYAIRF